MAPIIVFLLGLSVLDPCNAQSGLLCMRSHPLHVYKLPRVSPCRRKIREEGRITTKTPNEEAYVTDAWLVSLDTCWANSTTGFFGAHTCVQGCSEQTLDRHEALDIKNGFCPDLGLASHTKFDSFTYSQPTCQYYWMTSHTIGLYRCERARGHIIYKHGGLPHSTLSSNIPCDYMKGECRLGLGRWMFWEVDERSQDDWSYTYNNTAVCDGRRVALTSKAIGFGLKEEGCKWSGWKGTVEGVFLKWESYRVRSNRRKRSTDRRFGTLHEFLASALDTMSGTFCETMIGVVPASSLIAHSNPSVYARLLLENDNLVAEAYGDFLIIWQCQAIPIKPRNGSCYSTPRIEYWSMGEWKEGYLDATMEIRTDSPRVSCSHHSLYYAINDTAYIENGELTYPLSVTTLSFKTKDLLTAFTPNFTHVYFSPPPLDIELRDVIGIQDRLVEHARHLGASIGGTGGGHGLTNVPGFKFGFLDNFVAFLQTVGSMGGLIYIICMLLKAMRPAPRAIRFVPQG
ncbi:glycoprotein [Wenzhou Crab Virus 1]|uniref:Glycoprotein n=1 Tax=Wenzhou Crab Virus 1 TaxID=1608091 RepID=A0A0B5KXH5_9MONO|nr:glycoprotein [Wenzhou Crab Virus 1]AJG39153.1 glycoprotein [Wenzhou Crab Virus 1]